MNTQEMKFETKEYKGYTTEDYKNAVLEYSKAMFDLFDKEKRFGSGQSGLSLMWYGTWTQQFIACEVIDLAIETNQKLSKALVDKFIEISPEQKSNLEQIKALLKE